MALENWAAAARPAPRQGLFNKGQPGPDRPVKPSKFRAKSRRRGRRSWIPREDVQSL